MEGYVAYILLPYVTYVNIHKNEKIYKGICFNYFARG